jgi:hypothetical protein
MLGYANFLELHDRLALVVVVVTLWSLSRRVVIGYRLCRRVIVAVAVIVAVGSKEGRRCQARASTGVRVGACQRAVSVIVSV